MNRSSPPRKSPSRSTTSTTFSVAMLGGAVARLAPLTCTGPIAYRGQEALRRDLDNLRTALNGVVPREAFVAAIVLPSGVGKNQYYDSEQEYLEAINRGLRGLPEEKIRFHTCYGINEGPRVHDVPLEEIIDLVMRVHAGAYSFESANPRHEHEYHLWERVQLPDGKIIIPGVVTHSTNIVEHPELIAERIVR